MSNTNPTPLDTQQQAQQPTPTTTPMPMPMPMPTPAATAAAAAAAATAAEAEAEAEATRSAKHGLSPIELVALRDAAVAAKTSAYCPYSRFRVGAALLILVEGGGGGQYDAASASASSSSGQGRQRTASSSPPTTTTSTAIVRGCNVENASYPVGICAERVAFGAAIAQGFLLVAGAGAGAGAGGTGVGSGSTVRALAVATDVVPPASPCGMCRQAIREFCSSNVPIIMFDKNLDYDVWTVEELLPCSFGPNHLLRPSPSPPETNPPETNQNT